MRTSAHGVTATSFLGTIAVVLRRMERDGLITREAHTEDRRATRISLTQKARARLPEARTRLGKIGATVTEGFTKSERDAFMGLLQRAVGNLNRLRAEK